ncbi:hypothetical protein AVEN_250590-1, partial [Araneus ventricosus]
MEIRRTLRAELTSASPYPLESRENHSGSRCKSIPNERMQGSNRSSPSKLKVNVLDRYSFKSLSPLGRR